MKPRSLPPLKVPCPKCGAQAGVRCVSGRTVVTWFHRQRKDAAIEEPAARMMSAVICSECKPNSRHGS